jgi:DNA repair exonuclease SbcCD nuclease subunit
MWGDVHKRQKIQDLPHARYCGAPLQHNFGDEPDKGVYIWDNFKPKFVRIPSKELVTVKENEEIPTDKYVRMLTSRCDATLPDNCVKVELAFEQTAPILTDGDDVWVGLSEQLAAQGLSAEQQTAAIELTKSLQR